MTPRNYLLVLSADDCALLGAALVDYAVKNAREELADDESAVLLRKILAMQRAQRKHIYGPKSKYSA